MWKAETDKKSMNYKKILLNGQVLVRKGAVLLLSFSFYLSGFHILREWPLNLFTSEPALSCQKIGAPSQVLTHNGTKKKNKIKSKMKFGLQLY